jgi:hypothetical protein
MKTMTISKFLLLLIILILFADAVCATTSVNMTYQSNLGWYRFESLPKGEVIFDGVSYGDTPVTVPITNELKPPHEVTIKMDGYEEYYRQLDENPEDGETILVTLNTSLIRNIQNLLTDGTP